MEPSKSNAFETQDALANAVSAHKAGRYDEAERLYANVLAAYPDHAQALTLLGTLKGQRGALDDALALLGRSLAKNPVQPLAHNSLGNVLVLLHRHDEALRQFEAAIAIDSDCLEAHENRGKTLQELGRFEAALASFENALAISPKSARIHGLRGGALVELGRYEEAIESCNKAIAIDPTDADSFHHRMNAFKEMGHHTDALADSTTLIGLDADRPYFLGEHLAQTMEICEWRGLEDGSQELIRRVGQGQRTALPFSFLKFTARPELQRQCAEIYANDKYPASPSPVWTGERYAHEKIRIAYLSADFHNHATAYLMAGLFEAHDAARFEVSAISFGPDDTGGMRHRLQRSFHRFVDARQTGDRDIARLLREMEIDIAVDLKGFTKDCRPEIFAHRGAPVQVSYLGYPGTMGADYIDYILADSCVIPPGSERFYAERVVRLPETYQVNDRKRRIAERTPSRAELGLPDTGFVFCCFNNNYKITPFVFDIWMRLLKRVEGSVLWLLQDNAQASRNLIREAEQRGIASNRLVFAPRLDLPDHLARHRCADLFLDTLPCNAHTTASDALWAGLPLLTCMGETFASRVAGSLLRAAGLPELATQNLTDYEALAYQLATAPNMLDDIKARLARGRDTCPLFDTNRFRRHIEAAYATMHERHRRGQPPASFDVTPSES